MTSATSNLDLLYEIFGHFVTIDKEGPLTLLLVSSSWRDAVVRHPPLWVWITLDEAKVDWETRLHIFSLLSAEFPLRLALKLPFSDRLASSLKSHISRVQDIFIDLPNYIEEEEAFQILSQFVNTLKIPDMHIYCSKNEQQVYLTPPNMPQRWNQLLKNSGEFSSQHPLNLITEISLTNVHPVHLSQLMPCLSVANHLGRLFISQKSLVDDLLAGGNRVSLPFLTVLGVDNIDSPPSLVHPGLIAFASNIQCPRTLMLTLRGTLCSLVLFISTIGTLQPSKLSLFITNITKEQADPSKDIKLMQFIHELIIDLKQDQPLGKSGVNQINQLVKALPEGSTLRLGVNEMTIWLLDRLERAPAFLHVKYKAPRIPNIPNCEWDQALACADSMAWMDTFTVEPIKTRVTTSSIHFLPAELTTRCGRLIMDRNSSYYYNSPIEHSYLESEIDFGYYRRYWRGSTFQLEDESSPSFQNLTVVSGTPSLITTLITEAAVPQLSTINLLTSNAENNHHEQCHHFIRLVRSITSLGKHGHPRYPSLFTISFDWYPPWFNLMELLQFIMMRHRNISKTNIILPSLPHPNILRSLVQIFQKGRRQPSIQKLFVSTTLQCFLPPEKDCRRGYYPGVAIGSRTCPKCNCSGWTCEGEKFCMRHSATASVIINQFTLCD